MSEKFTTVIVTVEVPYILPMQDEARTEINGWTVAEVIDNWFTRYDINRHHASRDHFQLGNGKRIVNVRTEPPSQGDSK